MLNRCPKCGSSAVYQTMGCIGCLFDIARLSFALSIIGLPLAMLMPKTDQVKRCMICGAKWKV